MVSLCTCEGASTKVRGGWIQVGRAYEVRLRASAYTCSPLSSPVPFGTYHRHCHTYLHSLTHSHTLCCHILLEAIEHALRRGARATWNCFGKKKNQNKIIQDETSKTDEFSLSLSLSLSENVFCWNCFASVQSSKVRGHLIEAQQFVQSF
jgi:hypothetical protein